MISGAIRSGRVLAAKAQDQIVVAETW